MIFQGTSLPIVFIKKRNIGLFVNNKNINNEHFSDVVDPKETWGRLKKTTYEAFLTPGE